MLLTLALLTPALAVTGVPDWTLESDTLDAALGARVAVIGDVNGDGYDDVAMTSNLYSSAPEVWIVMGSSEGLENFVTIVLEPTGPSWGFGMNLVGGDFNGDGYADLAVAHANYRYVDNHVDVYAGAPTGLEDWPSWTTESARGYGEYGAALATGDVNGDGYDELAIGDPTEGPPDCSYFYAGVCGAAEVFNGSSVGLGGAASWTWVPPAAASSFPTDHARALAFADLNGDGFDDLALGAPFHENPDVGEGLVLIFHGRATGLRTTPTKSLEVNRTGANLGRSIAAAGDVDGDGYEDLIVGAPTYENGLAYEGRAYLWRGAITGVAATPAWFVDGNQDGATLGSVQGAGDVDGDGYDDFLVAAPYFDLDVTDGGLVRLFRGSAAGPAAAPDAYYAGTHAGPSLGSLSAGDVNGDGYADVLVGDPAFAGGETDEGRAILWYGFDTDVVADTDTDAGSDTDAASAACAPAPGSAWGAFGALGLLAVGRRRPRGA